MPDILAQGPEATSGAIPPEDSKSQLPPLETKLTTNEVKSAPPEQAVSPLEAATPPADIQSVPEALGTAEEIAAHQSKLAAQADSLPPSVVPQKPEVRPAPVTLNQDRMEQGSPTESPLTKGLTSLQHARRRELAARHSQPEVLKKAA